MNPRLYSYFENFDVFSNSEDKLNKKSSESERFPFGDDSGNFWQKDFGFPESNQDWTVEDMLLLPKGIF
jgi:hypothetical protein